MSTFSFLECLEPTRRQRAHLLRELFHELVQLVLRQIGVRKLLLQLRLEDAQSAGPRPHEHDAGASLAAQWKRAGHM